MCHLTHGPPGCVSPPASAGGYVGVVRLTRLTKWHSRAAPIHHKSDSLSVAVLFERRDGGAWSLNSCQSTTGSASQPLQMFGECFRSEQVVDLKRHRRSTGVQSCPRMAALFAERTHAVFEPSAGPHLSYAVNESIRLKAIKQILISRPQVTVEPLRSCIQVTSNEHMLSVGCVGEDGAYVAERSMDRCVAQLIK